MGVVDDISVMSDLGVMERVRRVCEQLPRDCRVSGGGVLRRSRESEFRGGAGRMSLEEESGGVAVWRSSLEEESGGGV